MKSLSIEQLAEKLGGKLWIKEDKKRIYLDRGYNTKKMSTKTYVYQREDGTYGVSCYVDCPSQDYNWIKSQQNEVIKGVESDIEDAMSDTVYILTNKEGVVVGYDGKPRELNYSENFFAEEGAKEGIDNCTAYHSYITMPRADFDKEVERLDEIERLKRLEGKANQPVEENKQPGQLSIKIENTATPDYGIGSKVNHKRFGIGEVITESDTILQVQFGDDLKSLLKQFVSLTKVEDAN